MLSRGDAAYATETAEIAVNKPSVFTVFFIPFLHLLCIYSIIVQKIMKGKN
jgi:hypothetical protein